MKKCPICKVNELGEEGANALSRKDNETEICSDCATKEALDAHFGMNMTTIKQQLVNAGMKESEIDTYSSDLYVLVNEVSKEWLSTYEFKVNVTTFRSELDGKLWYDIPFGYIAEYKENKSK